MVTTRSCKSVYVDKSVRVVSAAKEKGYCQAGSFPSKLRTFSDCLGGTPVPQRSLGCPLKTSVSTQLKIKLVLFDTKFHGRTSFGNAN